jgi:esterase
MILNYKTYGQGPPVIIMHGLFGMLENWQTIARKLAADYSVYTVDLRNHGKSPHSEVFDYCAMAADVVEFMASQGFYAAHLMGHSMGGKVAMQMAMEYPSHVQKLIVVDIAPKVYAPGHVAIFDALGSVDFSKVSRRSDVEGILMEQINHIGIVRFLLKNLARDPDGGYRWKMNLDVIRSQYHNVNADVISGDPFDGPALFLRGGMSPYVSMDDWPQIEALFPNAVLETIKGAGHWVHAEKPEELLRAVVSFLD